jgi:hypothetical protein
MGVTLGWVAFALAGLAGAPHAERDKPQITYTVRMVEAEGVGWREGVYARLKPVTRQGAATVWTVPRDATTRLLEEVNKSPAARILQAPKVTSSSGVPATIQCRRSLQLVTQAAWNVDEPAPAGTLEKVRAGWHTTMVARKLDQGILVQVVFEDTVIRAVHHVNVNRSGEPKCSAASAAPISEPQAVTGGGNASALMAIASSILGNEACAAQKCNEPQACCPSAESGGKDRDVRKVVLDVPEIDNQEVVGEWLIPSGDVLLVSFGAYTVADKDGKAVVKERLAIIEVDLASTTTPLNGPTPASPAPAPIFPPSAALLPIPLPKIATTVPKIAMPNPTMPSRSIPQGVHADGTPADLPPLPADETETDSSASEPSQPMPSPQTKKTRQTTPKAATDSGASKAEFSQPKSPTLFLPSLFLPSPSVGFQFLLPIKPLSFKLPFGQRIEIEILGRIVPDSQVGN